MTQSVRDFERTFAAEADLSSSKYRFVKPGTNDNQIAAAAAATDTIIGVLQNKPQANEHANVRFLGTTKVEAGGAVTKGDYVTSDANGKAVVTTTEGNQLGGIALEATTNGDGDYIEVLLVTGTQFTSTAA